MILPVILILTARNNSHSHRRDAGFAEIEGSQRSLCLHGECPGYVWYIMQPLYNTLIQYFFDDGFQQVQVGVGAFAQHHFDLAGQLFAFAGR